LRIEFWFAALACVALIAYLLQKRATPADASVKRLALLTGTHRVLGESDVSLRRRSVALSRWPYTKEEPEVAWWGRAAAKVLRKLHALDPR
jgi:hypothetical protein